MVFYHPVEDTSLTAHCDDFTFCGEEDGLMWIKGWMDGRFNLKFTAIWGTEIIGEGIDGHGTTRLCAVCGSFYKGASRQPQSDQCTGIFWQSMREKGKVKNYGTRQ